MSKTTHLALATWQFYATCPLILKKLHGLFALPNRCAVLVCTEERKRDEVVEGIAYRKKKYVDVVARHSIDGGITPQSIVWGDGIVYEIDRVLDKRQAASLKVGGNGVRYLIRIGEKETFLFYEGPQWFVEAIVNVERP